MTVFFSLSQTILKEHRGKLPGDMKKILKNTKTKYSLQTTQNLGLDTLKWRRNMISSDTSGGIGTFGMRGKEK